MKVKELIEELNKKDPEALVLRRVEDSLDTDASSIAHVDLDKMYVSEFDKDGVVEVDYYFDKWPGTKKDPIKAVVLD